MKVQAKSYTFYDGNVLTIRQAVNKYGMSRSFIRKIVASGEYRTFDFSKPHPTKGYKIKARDHTGKEFNSFAEMCRFWKVDYYRFYHRLRKLSVEEAIASLV